MFPKGDCGMAYRSVPLSLSQHLGPPPSICHFSSTSFISLFILLTVLYIILLPLPELNHFHPQSILTTYASERRIGMPCHSYNILTTYINATYNTARSCGMVHAPNSSVHCSYPQYLFATIHTSLTPPYPPKGRLGMVSFSLLIYLLSLYHCFHLHLNPLTFTQPYTLPTHHLCSRKGIAGWLIATFLYLFHSVTITPISLLLFF